MDGNWKVLKRSRLIETIVVFEIVNGKPVTRIGDTRLIETIVVFEIIFYF